MFSRMSIRAKLFFIVYLMTALVIGIGAWGFYLAYQAGDLLVQVYEDEIRPIRDLQQMSDLLRIDIVDTVESLYRGQVSYREGAETLHTQVGQLRNDWVAFQGQKKLEQSQQEAATLARLESSLSTIFDRFDEFDALIELRDRTALAAFADTEIRDAITPYRKATNQLVSQRLRQVERTYVNARKEFLANLGFVLAVAAFGILLAVVLCLVITRGIHRSLGNMNNKLGELAEGEADLSQRIELTSTDEIGSLARNFNRLMGNLEALVQQVKKSGVLVSTSTTDIAAGTKELEATATEQAASTHEVVASAKEISATSQELLNTMTEVASLSEKTSASASQGQKDLGEIEKTMSRIEEAARTVGDHLTAISEKAGKISSVVDTINKVADQTNLLSLNAAIEAEKAGEYGRGFAVVAREIRRLADQTAVATLDIENTVGEMKDAVTSGVGNMKRFATQIQDAVSTVDTVSGGLGEIIGQIQTLNPQFELVFDGMQTQAIGARQISDSMMVLGEASQQTAENLRDTNEAIARLNEAASGLQKEFARFSVS